MCIQSVGGGVHLEKNRHCMKLKLEFHRKYQLTLSYYAKIIFRDIES